jgi:serine/threonine protein kinase/tetratricopeptide (TPR) repeat protein
MSPERWHEIEEVFQTAVEMPPAERAPYLDDRCGQDDELRGEVMKLLASDDSAADFIEVPIWTDSRFLNTSAKKEISNSLDQQFNGNDRDSFLGKEVGVYKLTKEIGRGGMGAVYLADRADGEFQQRVAIKLIKRGMDSDFIVRRFRHERQILASFEHPFIARLLDGGTTTDGVPYFVMEYVEGETLYKYADGKRLSTRDRLKLFQKVCSAIDYAHEKKIIHRDIKPSNIIINKFGSPKLLDFGIAKILDPNLIHESINPTASMLRMMTPDYASPEQVQGADVTPQSDIYSLGVLLYELLTGHKPYDFAGRSIHEVSRVICDVLPPAPSAVLSKTQNLLPQYSASAGRYLAVRSTSEKQLIADLTSGLDNIVMKAMAKDPEDRYDSVGELSRDISRFLSGSRVEAPSFAKARRQSTDTFLRVPENSKSLAVLPFKFMNLGPAGDETDDRFLGVGLADALITRLSKVRRFVVRPTSSILSFEQDILDPIRAGRELSVDYILDGSIKKAGDRLRVTIQLLSVSDNAAVWATSIDETLSDVLTLEDTLSNKVIEVLLPQLTGGELQEFAKRGTEIPEAFEHYLRGRYHFNTFTEEGFAKAFVSFHSAIAADPNYAHAYAGLADYYNWLGILGVLPPQECFLPAIDAASKAIEIDDDLSEGHASLGFSLHAGNYEWSKAEHHLRRAMELNPSNANAFVWYSIVLFTEGRFDEGLDFARRGVEIDPLTPFNHHNVGWGLYYARRFDEAAERYRRVIADFPTYSFGYYGLSKIHRITGETKLAIAENDQANELMGGSVFSLLSEAECYAADGQTAVAKEKIATLEKMSQDRYVSPYQLALAYRYLGDSERALNALERAVELKEAWLNWLGVEPAFDPIRGDKRFDDILEHTGYRMFFKNFSNSGVDLDANGQAIRAKNATVHDLTTLVIEESDKTDDGIRPAEPVRLYAKWPFVIIAVMSILAFSWAFYHFFLEARDRQPSLILAPAGFQNPSIVVLPFGSDDLGSANIDPNVGVGFADALTQKLGSIKALRVLSASTGRAIDPTYSKEVAADLGVAFILKGKLSWGKDTVTLDADLVNAAADSVLWSETFEAKNGDLADLQTKVAEKLWTSLHIEPLPLERQQIEKRSTENPAAYQEYLIGRSLMADRSAENLRKAIVSFSGSVKTDPNFALAYIGLADAYALLNLYDIDPPDDAYEQAKLNAQRALLIDDTLAEAHATLAYVKFYGERNRETAELEFRRAIQLNPSYAQAHHWFAIVLAAMNDRIEAISEAQIAEQLDPRSPAVKAAKAMTYAFNNQYAEAVAECDAALQLDERFMPAIRVKRWTYVAAGDFAAARSTFAKEVEYAGGSVEDPGWRLVDIQLTAPTEDRAAKLKLLEETVRSDEIQRNQRAFAFEAALAFNALGETEKALDWLAKSEAARGHSFNFLEVDPRIQNLKEEPRFRKLLEKLRGPR